MQRIVLILALVATFLGLSTWAFRSWTAQQVEIRQLRADAQSAQEARERAEATLARLAQKNAATARLRASTGASLRAAAASAPQWAEQPLPDHVRQALIGQE